MERFDCVGNKGHESKQKIKIVFSISMIFIALLLFSTAIVINSATNNYSNAQNTNTANTLCVDNDNDFIAQNSADIVGNYDNQKVQFMQKSCVGAENCFANKFESEVVIEQSGRKVLHAKNKDMKLEMASTTKILTALVAIENNSLDKKFVIPKEAVGVEGSSIYLHEKEVWTIGDLLYGLMLRSGNDAATALAIATSGSVEKFVVLMNNYSQKLGLKQTHFDNPHGLHSENHYTTAYELALITAMAMDNDTFCKIVATKTYEVKANETHGAQYFGNKNKILNMYEGGNGVKTGYTTQSGRCLVSSAKRNGMQLISVVINCGDMWNVSMSNMTNVFDNFEKITLGKANTILYTIKAKNGEVSVALQDDIICMVGKKEKLNFDFSLNIDKNMQLPIKKGDIIGHINIFSNNCLLFSTKIITMNEINDRGVLISLTNLVGKLHIEDKNGEIKQIFGIIRGGIS